MSANGYPMIELLTQLTALAASNAALQGQVATLQSGVPAPASASYSRTPAFMGKMDLLSFRKKEDLSIYAESKRSVFEGD